MRFQPPSSIHKPTNLPHLTFGKGLQMGFLVTLLSPKASLFFTSIFAGLITTSTPWWAIIALGIIMPLNSLLMASLLAYIFSHPHLKKIYDRYQTTINLLLGGCLFLFAISLALWRG